MEYSILQEKAKENGIKIGFFKKKFYQKIALLIPDSEEILCMASGYDTKEGNDNIVIVTMENVYIIRRPVAFSFGVVNKTCIPISQITSISNTGALGDLVITDGTVQHEAKWLGPVVFRIIEFVNQIKRYNESEKNKVAEQTKILSTAEQIRELKGLLDDGLITQEEFDAKKKQILGI